MSNESPNKILIFTFDTKLTLYQKETRMEKVCKCPAAKTTMSFIRMLFSE